MCCAQAGSEATFVAFSYLLSWDYGGEGGIRTPDRVTPMPDFESGAFNRALPPLRRGNSLRIRAIRAIRHLSLYPNQGSESGPAWTRRTIRIGITSH
jgi:hypothetical protein